MTVNDLDRLVDSLAVNSSLHTLDLSRVGVNSFMLSRANLRSMMMHLASSCCISHLHLSGHENYMADARAISDMLRTNKSLQVLILNHSGIRDHELEMLTDSLGENWTLMTLDLGYNGITINMTKVLGGFGRTFTLRTLN